MYLTLLSLDYAFFPWDLSTSSSSGFEMLVPSIRSGHVRIQVKYVIQHPNENVRECGN